MGKDFFEFKVQGLDRLGRGDWDTVLLTRLENPEEDVKTLVGMGVDLERIAVL